MHVINTAIDKIICRTKLDYDCQQYNTSSAGRLKKLDSIHRKCLMIERTKTTKKARSIKPMGVYLRRLEQRYTEKRR